MLNAMAIIILGSIDIASLLRSPFGYKNEFSPEQWFQPEIAWNFESLHI